MIYTACIYTRAENKSMLVTDPSPGRILVVAESSLWLQRVCCDYKEFAVVADSSLWMQSVSVAVKK